ncbi:MAG: outer membrane beta-barrel protein [Bacteroidales bacterium]|nr:outer membrane beta-barrel protein [Bacteroidales bacterium]
MKKTIILTILALFATSLSAQTGTIRQSIPDGVCNVNVGNKFLALIHFDNASYVEFPSLSEKDIQKIKASNMITIKNDSLFLGNDSCKQCSGTVQIHLDSTNKQTTLCFADNAHGYFNNLCNNKIKIETRNNSQAYLSKTLGDTLWCKRLVVTTYDKSYVTFPAPLVGDTIDFVAFDDSRISAYTIDCNYLYYNEPYHNKNINIHSHKNIRHEGYVYQHESSCYEQSIVFDFAWGFHNWGSNPFNGLSTLEDAYELRTTPSSFQLALKYSCPIICHKLYFNAGLGYESDVYKFRNQYVTFEIDGNRHLAISELPYPESKCSTKLVTRYITFPVGLIYSTKKDFNFSITLIPGINYTSSHTGLKYDIQNGDENTYHKENPRNFINPYKLDVRFAFGYKYIHFFIQPSLLPVFINTDQKVYPIKIGIMI